MARGRMLGGLAIALSLGAVFAAPAPALARTGPPIGIDFPSSTVPVNGTVELSIIIFGLSPSEVPASMTITLGPGLEVASPVVTVDHCFGGALTAPAGATTIMVSGGIGALVTSSCNVGVNVEATSPGTLSASVNFTSTSIGDASGSATIDALAPPSIGAGFDPDSIAAGGQSILSFSISNPDVNDVALTGVGFGDTLPLGLAVATDSITVCGGTLTTSPSDISLTYATIAVGSECEIDVTVSDVPAGYYETKTGAIGSDNGGTGNTASAALSSGFSAPLVEASFGATSIGVGDTTSLTFTIVNPNILPAGVLPADMGVMDLTNVSLDDTLPAGLAIATPNGQTGDCGGGTVSAPAGGTSISLSGGTILGEGSECTFSVDVVGVAAGDQDNSTGPVYSREAPAGEPGSAIITVVGPSEPTPSPTPTPTPSTGAIPSRTAVSTATPPTTSTDEGRGSGGDPAPQPLLPLMVAPALAVAYVIRRWAASSIR